MSYDVYIEVPTGRGDETARVVEFNYTGNVSPMWSRALAAVGCTEGTLGDFIDAHGLSRPGHVADLCAAAAVFMDSHRTEFEAMNPPNGWGDADGARDFLASIAYELSGRTNCVVTVCR